MYSDGSSREANSISEIEPGPEAGKPASRSLSKAAKTGKPIRGNRDNALLLFVRPSIPGYLTVFNLATRLVIALAVGAWIAHEEQLLAPRYPEYS
jgi:hypothetical protein